MPFAHIPPVENPGSRLGTPERQAKVEELDLEVVDMDDCEAGA